MVSSASRSGAQSMSSVFPGTPGPPEKADLIDDISRVGTIGSQIVSNWCAAGREESA